VPCHLCKKILHWRELQCKKIWVHRQQTKNDKEDDFYWERTCIPCVAKEEGITEEDAKLQVLAGPMEHKAKRAHQFKLAVDSKREEWEALAPGEGPSRKERRKLTLASMEELFQPLAEFIVRKREAMELVVKDVERHNELVRALAKCKSIEQEKAILEEMEKLEIDDKYLAFADKGQEEQHKYILAASYSDEWTECKRDGRLVGGICSWYVCKAKTAYDEDGNHVQCFSVIPSKDWNRKFDDPLASKQRWYCHCGAEYNATWGQLVEIKIVGTDGQVEHLYMKLDVPSWDAEDVRAMCHEATMDPASPMELYNNVKRVVPTVSNLIVASGSHRKICNTETWDSLPLFRWSEIFSMANIQPPKGCK